MNGSEKRLAVVISGAVSLGAYEAGVLYEVFEALAQHNTNPQTTDEEKILVDVITGASAGGMSAAILAQKLQLDGQSLRHPYDNPLYNPWVAEVDITELLKLRGADNEDHSLLSGEFVQLEARKHLSLNAASGRHPAAADKIHLGLAMANVDGIDYQKATKSGGSFSYTRYQDEFIREVSKETAAKLDWKELGVAACACGAFPFAFPLVPIVRSIADVDRLKPAKRPSTLFRYTDGGTFQNEPLGLARELIRANFPTEAVSRRFYLFIAPSDREVTSTDITKRSDLRLLTSLKGILGSIFQQARFHDWITAEETNEALALLDARANELAWAISHDPALVGVLQPGCDALLQLLFPDAKTLEGELARVKKAFLDDEYQSDDPTGYAYNLNPAQKDAWLRAVLVLETAAQLGNRDYMHIESIVAERSELAGNLISAFVGFFDRRLRAHDYDLGRMKARAWVGSLENGPLGPIRYEAPVPIHKLDPQISKLAEATAPAGGLSDDEQRKRQEVAQKVFMEVIDRKSRVDFRDQAVDRVKRVVDAFFDKDAKAPFYKRWTTSAQAFALKTTIGAMARNKLNTLLGL